MDHEIFYRHLRGPVSIPFIARPDGTPIVKDFLRNIKKLLFLQRKMPQLDSMFRHLYVDSDEESEDSKSDESESHQLDQQPHSFLRLSNSSEVEGMFSTRTPCRYTPNADGTNDKTIIPEISRRSLMRWPVGAQLASGMGAVVYNVDCGETKCTKVARISQLRTTQDTIDFTRDVHARYLLSCQCDTIQITGLIDAFICMTDTKNFGVTISDQYDGTLVKHLLSLSSTERGEFVKYAKKRLVFTVSKMHACKIVHRDLHHGNILLHHPPGGGDLIIALTDFERALGDYFETDPQVFSAYVHSDNRAILALIAELKTVCKYLDKKTDVLDIHLLDALGIGLSDLLPLREIDQVVGVLEGDSESRCGACYAST